jgi:hypothetical protein
LWWWSFILQLTFATSKPLFLLVQKTVAKLTICATSGKKIGGRSFCLVFDDLRNLESLANARACFWTSDNWVHFVQWFALAIKFLLKYSVDFFLKRSLLTQN